MKYERPPSEFVDELRSQLGFIDRSAASFDEGYEDEGKRLAGVIRLLVYDTKYSHSLLGQLAVKDRLRFLDTAAPIHPANLVTTPGLVVMHFKGGGDEPSQGNYVARCKAPGFPAEGTSKLPFADWWNRPVTKDGLENTFAREDFVLALANKDGGAHVDPKLDQAYADLSRNNSMGWQVIDGQAGTDLPFGGNIVLPCLRQIAHEVRQTLPDAAVDALASGGNLPSDDIGRNDPCWCGNGKKYKKCHGA